MSNKSPELVIWTFNASGAILFSPKYPNMLPATTGNARPTKAVPSKKIRPSTKSPLLLLMYLNNRKDFLKFALVSFAFGRSLLDWLPPLPAIENQLVRKINEEDDRRELLLY